MDAGVKGESKGQHVDTMRRREIFAYANGQRRRHVAHRMGYFSFEKGIEEKGSIKGKKLDFAASIVRDGYSMQGRTGADTDGPGR